MAKLFASATLLPEFDTLLIKGPYPPSAPLTLAINHLSQKDVDERTDVLLLTPSREAFASALQEYNDARMNESALTGSLVPLMTGVRI